MWLIFFMKKNNKRNSLKQSSQKGTGFINKIKWYLVLTGILAVTVLIYKPAMNYTITGWDDNNYLKENKLIHSLDKENIKKIFSFKEGVVLGNFHPFTILSYAVEYKYAELNPKVYHTTNIILHLINVLLVFVFIKALSRNSITACVTSLLFAVHPMHVESVAWIAERKDLLYVMFGLLSIIFYLKYISDNKKSFLLYLFALLFFIVSILSKAMAVSVAVILPLIDYYTGRKLFDRKVILEKIPFFIIAVVLGTAAIGAQGEAIDVRVFSFYDRILFASYGVITYIWKLFIPVSLSTFYDYPPTGTYSWYIVYDFYIIVIAFAAYLSMRRTKVVVFGFLFFLVAVVLVLQVLPVGAAIMADRYTYFSSIGLFFMAGEGISYIAYGKTRLVNSLKPFVFFVFAAASIWYMVSAGGRCEVWKNTFTIWDDAIGKFPNTVKAYNGRGDGYMELGQHELAIRDFDKALSIQHNYPEAYYNRGLAHYKMYDKVNAAGEKERGIEYLRKSISDNSMALVYNPKLSRAYYNRSGSYFYLNMYDSALSDAIKAQVMGFEVDTVFIDVLKKNIVLKQKK